MVGWEGAKYQREGITELPNDKDRLGASTSKAGNL